MFGLSHGGQELHYKVPRTCEEVFLRLAPVESGCSGVGGNFLVVTGNKQQKGRQLLLSSAPTAPTLDRAKT